MKTPLIAILFLTVSCCVQSATPTTIQLSYQSPLEGKIYSNNIFITKDKETINVYGYDQANPTIEWDHMFWNSKKFGGNGGTFTTAKNGAVPSFGLIQYFSGETLGGKLSGYLQISHQNESLLLQAPNTRLLWRAGDLAIGIGGTFSLSNAGQPCIVGPMIERKTTVLNQPTTFRLRVGKWVSGPSEGQTQVRVDIIVKL